jgi:hypothetical protein
LSYFFRAYFFDTPNKAENVLHEKKAEVSRAAEIDGS